MAYISIHLKFFIGNIGNIVICFINNVQIYKYFLNVYTIFILYLKNKMYILYWFVKYVKSIIYFWVLISLKIPIIISVFNPTNIKMKIQVHM